MYVIDTISSIARSTIELAPNVRQQVGNCLVYDNWNEVDPQQGKALRQFVYKERVSVTDAILLARFATPVSVYGHSFLARAGDVWLKEQVHPKLLANSDDFSAALQRARLTEEVSEDTVLVARYGIATWGHWLGELLPKIVLAERAFPGRFCYAFPYAVVYGPEASIWSAIRESLIAYQVGPERWTALRDDTLYHFKSMIAITPTWSNFSMHPLAVAAMREDISHFSPAVSHDRKTALLRTETQTRKLHNRDQVSRILLDDGYELHEAGRLPFCKQVELFQTSGKIAAVLGSSLTGLIYSPRGVKVLSFAPHNFGDRFFYALIQNRGGRYADVRGPVVEAASISHWATFGVDPAIVNEALVELDGSDK